MDRIEKRSEGECFDHQLGNRYTFRRIRFEADARPDPMREM
jgi:hypothetical protein